MKTDESMREYTMTLEASDPRLLDEQVDVFRKEVKELGGTVFHSQSHVTINPVLLAEMIAGKRLQEGEGGLVYTHVVFYRLPETEWEKEHMKGTEKPTDRHGLKIKKENENKKRWCSCPTCKMRFAYNYFSHCRCGNNKVPPELQREYDEVWGKGF